MIDKVIERFKDGEYDSVNGRKLFELDMQEIKSQIDKIESELWEYEYGDETDD